MRRAGRTLWHVVLLGALLTGVGYAVFAMLEFAGMTAGFTIGLLAPPELTVERVVFSVLMVTVWGPMLWAGLSTFMRMWRRTRRLSRWVAEVGIPASPHLAAARERAEIRCVVVELGDSAPYAFTYGLWRPRIAVSSGLVAVAGREEMRAVLHHEGHHVRHRDPLKVLVFRTCAATFYLVPMIGALLHRLLARAELAADRTAVDRCGVASVAGALLKAAGEPAPHPGAALAAMAGPALLGPGWSSWRPGSLPDCYRR